MKQKVPKKISKLLILVMLPAVTFLTFGIFMVTGFASTYVSALAQNGGGFYVKGNSTLTIDNETIVSGNKAQNGGGIYIDNEGTLIVDGGTISGNTATSGNGHDIYNAGTTTINNGTIGTGESSQTDFGIYNSGTITINGGTIYDNIYSSVSFVTKCSATIKGTITLGNSAILFIEEYKGITPEFNIKILETRSNGVVAKIYGEYLTGETKPDLKKINFVGLAESQDIGLEKDESSTEESPVWNLVLKVRDSMVSFQPHGIDENNLFGLDGTFELYDEGDDLLETLQSQIGDGGTVEVSTEQPYAETKALKLSGVNKENENNPRVYSIASGYSGKSYIFDAMVYSTKACDVVLQIMTKDGDNMTLISEFGAYSNPGEWQRVTVQTPTLSADATLCFVLSTTCGQTVFFDQVSARDSSSINGALLMKVTYGEPRKSLPQPERTGYFVNVQVGPDHIWVGAPTSSLWIDIEGVSCWGITEDVIIETYWNPYSYRVNFDVNSNGEDVTFDSTDGLAYDSKNEQYYDMLTFDKKPDNFPVVERKGYTFGGWFFDGKQIASVSGEVKSSFSGLTDENGNWKCVNEITVTATWNANTYKLIYETNGGNSIDPKDKTYATKFTSSELPTPTKQGYEFVGWYRNSALEGDKLSIADTFDQEHAYFANIAKSETNATIYAKWEIQKHSVTLYVYTQYGTNTATKNSDGGTVSGVGTSITYGTTLTISATAKTGYTFSGWYSGDGVTGNKVTPISTMGESDVVYSALFTANTYKLIYETNGGNSIDPKDKTYATKFTSSELPTPTKQGYEFVGWYRNSALEGDKLSIADTFDQEHAYFANIAKSETNATIYAKWEIQKHSVTLYVYTQYGTNTATKISDGGTVSGAGTSITYGTTLTISATAKTGYIFSGWYSGNGVTGNKVTPISTMGESDVVYSALFTANTYKLTLNAVGGFFDASNSNGWSVSSDSKTASKDVTYNVKIGTLPKIAQMGYDFDYYYISNDSEGETFDGSTYVYKFTIDKTAYAQWQKGQYKLTLDPDGGEFSDGSSSTKIKTVLYGQINNDLPEPTRDGYEFKGWAVEFDGSSHVNFGRDYMYTNAISIHFSAYSEDWSLVASQRLISCTEAGGWSIEGKSYNSSGNVVFTAYNKDAGYKNVVSTIGWEDDSTDLTLTNGCWHDFDLIFDGSYLYGCIDGKCVAKSEIFSSGAIGYNPKNSILLGAEAGSGLDDSYNHGYASNFVGKIANLVISQSGSYLNVDNSWITPAQDVTMKAVWEKVSYNIILEEGAGTIEKTHYSIDETSPQGISLTVPSKDGHTFKGWTVSWADEVNSGTKKPTITTSLILTIPAGCYGNIRITSNGFIANTYQITLSTKANGGTLDLGGLSQKVVYITYGTNIFKSERNGSGYPYSIAGTEVKPKATKENNNFAGWYSYDGEILIVSSEGELVKNAGVYTDENGNWARGDAIISAKYNPWTYTIKIEPGTGATVSSLSCTANTGTSIKTAKSSITATFEQEGTFTAQMTYKGYTFSGWESKISGNTLSSSETSTSFTVSSNTRSGSSHTVITKAYCKVSDGATITLTANWTQNSYTITLDPGDGASVSPKTITVATGEGVDSIASKLPIPTKTGYNFLRWRIDSVGWFTYYDSDGNLYVYSIINGYISDGKWDYDGDITLVADWEAKVIHITLDPTAGGIYSISSAGTTDLYFRYGTTAVYKTYSDGTLSNLTATIVTPEGYGVDFDGYTEMHVADYVFADGSINIDKLTSFSKDTIIQATWIMHKIEITFNANGGYFGSNNTSLFSNTQTFYSRILIPITTVRDGYELDGFFTGITGGVRISTGRTPYSGSDGQGTSYIDSDGNWVYDIETITLYAHWTAKSYTITFDPGDDGSVSPTSKDVTYGEIFSNSDLPTPVRDDEYLFNGWYADFDGTDDFINLGREYMYTDTISIHFSAYSANWSLVKDQRLISCTETGGWNIEGTSSNGSEYVVFTAYDKGVGYKSVASSVKWSSLTAGWHDFDMVFDGSYLYGYIDGVQVAKSEKFTSGEIGYNSTNSIIVGAEASSGSTPAGSYFQGRIKNLVIKNSSAKISDYYKNSWITPAQHVTLKADWALRIYKITLENNGATTSEINEIYERYGTGWYLTLADATDNKNRQTSIIVPQKTGYEFNGYYLSESGSGTRIIDENGDLPSMSTYFSFDRTIYAYWTKISYTITLKSANDDFGAGSINDSTYTIDESSEQTRTLTAPSASGWTFTGWEVTWTDTSSSAHSTTKPDDVSASSTILTIPAGCYGNITLTAQWTEKTYTITLDKNGGSGGTTSVTGVIGEKLPYITYPTRATTNEVYEFLGYYYDGKKYYYPNDYGGSEGITCDLEENITLTAQWRQIYKCYNEGEYSYIEFGWWPQTYQSDVSVISSNKDYSIMAYECYYGTDGISRYAKIESSEQAYVTNAGDEIKNIENPHYFKVEPIKWRVLETYNFSSSNDFSWLNGCKLLLCENVLYALQFSSSGSNSYSSSDVRNWLIGLNNYYNNGFYQNAFMDKQKNYIQSCGPFTYSGVNLAYSGNDHVFLLAGNSPEIDFLTDTKKRNSTDFVRASYPMAYLETSKLYNNNKIYASWWTRSPGNEGFVVRVDSDGSIVQLEANWSECGIVPALVFNPNGTSTFTSNQKINKSEEEKELTTRTFSSLADVDTEVFFDDKKKYSSEVVLEEKRYTNDVVQLPRIGT